jgi:hypothetical protein
MAVHPEHSSFIQTLQKLYSSMVLFALNIGKKDGKHRSIRHHDGDIATPLHDYIEWIAQGAKARPGSEPDSGAEPLTPGSIDISSHTSRDIADGGSGTKKPRALARYFAGHNAATIMVPGMGEKLKKSTWGHLHEAIRFGRTGDVKNAKLHADLANGTLKEAIQYMSRDDFEDFLGEIEKKFDEVLAERKH